jgi:hypothetical protein
VVSHIIGRPEISDYIASRMVMEKLALIPNASPRDGIKPLDSHTTTERTSRRQKQEFRILWKTDGFAGLGK